MKFFALLAIFAFNLSLAHSQELTADTLAKICHQKTLRLSVCKTVRTSAPIDLTKRMANKIENTIESSTDSWGDSIYEGEVDGIEADLQYSTRRLIEKRTGNLLGYKVRFSYEGWETSCEKDDYDRTKPETFKSCKRGRIFQTILVSPDLKDYDVLSDADLILDKE